MKRMMVWMHVPPVIVPLAPRHRHTLIGPSEKGGRMCCRVPRDRFGLLAGAFIASLLCVSLKAQAPPVAPLPSQDGINPSTSPFYLARAQQENTLGPNTAIPTINAGGAVNAASYAAGAPLAPGSIVAVYGNFLLSAPSQSSALPLPTNLSGLSVQFGSVTAPLFYASSGQVNLQVPWELEEQATTPLSATLEGETGAAQTVQLAPFSPGIFTMNAQGTGQGAILDVSNRLVDDLNPAAPGRTVLQIFCTGLGAVTYQPPNGSPAPASPPLAETTLTPTVTVGTVPAKVLFSGLAPNYVGLYQVNAVVPEVAPAGSAVPVVISVGGAASNPVTTAVHGLSPSSAPAGSGPITVTVYGTGFTDMSAVTFNGTPQAVTLVGGTHLTIALSAAELAAAGTYPVVVTNPGGGSLSMNFTVANTAFSAVRSVNITALVTIGDQVLWSEIGVLATGGNTYQIGMGDQPALPAYPQFQVAFPCAPVSTGSSITFSSQSNGNESGGGVYQPDPTTPGGSMAAAAITIRFGAFAPGAGVSGAVTFNTAQGTVQGNFTGTITSVD